MLTDFHNFSCTTSRENAKVTGVKISCHTFVMLLPHRVKVSDTKVTHFTPILALCTCLYRSHLGQPVSTKQTKHRRKSEAQNLCSKCPSFTRTHAFNRLRHCAIANGFGGSVQSWCYAAALLGTRGQRWPLPECSSAIYASAGYPLCFRGLLRFSARWGTSTSCTWHCHHAAERETPEFIPPEMWPPTCNSPDLNPVDYSNWGMLQERVYRSWIHDVSWKNVERTTAEGVEAAGLCTPSSRTQYWPVMDGQTDGHLATA